MYAHSDRHRGINRMKPYSKTKISSLRFDRERERYLFFASAALVWAYGGHQVDGMALHLRRSYLVSRPSICCTLHTFYITLPYLYSRVNVIFRTKPNRGKSPATLSQQTPNLRSLDLTLSWVFSTYNRSDV